MTFILLDSGVESELLNQILRCYELLLALLSAFSTTLYVLLEGEDSEESNSKE